MKRNRKEGFNLKLSKRLLDRPPVFWTIVLLGATLGYFMLITCAGALLLRDGQSFIYITF